MILFSNSDILEDFNSKELLLMLNPETWGPRKKKIYRSRKLMSGKRLRWSAISTLMRYGKKKKWKQS